MTKPETLLWTGGAIATGGGGILALARAFEELLGWWTAWIPFAALILLAAGLFLVAYGAARKALDDGLLTKVR